ncbi:MAG: hypothetical protein IKR59_07655, partial [Lachnospiraceae bacterium]|nr:hypothetical protein [Lachnospiraceae bacterium]
MTDLYKKLDLRGKNDARKLIEDARLYEYGVNHHLLYHRMDDLKKEVGNREIPEIVFALNNNDFDRAFLSVVKDNIETVLLGMRIVTDLAGAENALIYLPEGEEEFGKALADAGAAYEIRYGIIPV